MIRNTNNSTIQNDVFEKRSVMERLSNPERYVLSEEEIAALPTDDDMIKVEKYLDQKMRNDIKGFFKNKKTRTDLKEVARAAGYSSDSVDYEDTE